MRRRIVFINVHWNHLFMNTPLYFLYKIKAPAKYAFLFKELLVNDNVEIINYVSSRGNIIPRTLGYLHFRFHSLLEAKFVLKRNGFDKKVRNITKVSEIRDDDIIISFIHVRGGCDDLELMKGRKIVQLNQYQFHKLNELNSVLPYANFFMLEANVFKKGNYILLSKLPINYEFFLVPYIVGNRFKLIKRFEDRKCKAIATGTIGICSNEDYIKHYGTDLCHKMRKVVYDHRDELKNYMDVCVSPYIENNKLLNINEGQSLFVRYFCKIYNYTIAGQGKQKGYFSFDIVSKYNDYQMAFVPEEIAGIPAIGAFEAMACGCAFIGINHSMYTDIGMIPGKHYISYDGTLEDLMRTIDYYQDHKDELKLISEFGHSFVYENLNEKRVSTLFMDSCLNLK